MSKKQLKDSQYILSYDDIKKMIDSTNNFRNRLIIKLLSRTGIRRAELVSITIQDIDFDNRRIRIFGKGDKERYVPITADLKTDIIQYAKGKKRGYLFAAKRKKRAHLEIGRINTIVAEIGESAGVKHPNPQYGRINPHIFRHSFAHHLLDNGMDWPKIRDILGHSSISVTLDLYGSSHIDKIQEDYDRILGDSIE